MRALTGPVPCDEEDDECEEDLRAGLEEGLEAAEHVRPAEPLLERVVAVPAVVAPRYQVPNKSRVYAINSAFSSIN